MERCEKHDVNLHDIKSINIFRISIQPHFDQYIKPHWLSDNPLSKVIALDMAWSFIWTWDNFCLPMQFNGSVIKLDKHTSTAIILYI